MNKLIFDLQRFGYIYNYTSNTLISGTSDADSIENGVREDYVTIDSGDGNDYINNSLNYDVMINSGNGNDSIYSQGIYSTLNAGDGDDFIKNCGETSNINTGDGDDTVYNWNRYSNLNTGENVIIFTGSGNDSIYNEGDSVTIDAGAGDDSIYNLYSYSVSINAGAGNDTIYLNSYSKNSKIQYANGDGNDYITGIKSSDTLQISGAKYTTTKSGDDLIVGVGSGSITVVGGANVAFTIDGTLDSGGGSSGITIYSANDNTIISGTSGDDYLFNQHSNVTVNGGDGDDDLFSNVYSSLSLINGGNGKDKIRNYGENTTIYGGNGNDSIENGAVSVVIYGGEGDDYISNPSNKGNNTTINGGKGNDIIFLSELFSFYHLIQYANGDGNDSIKGINESDTLQIIGAKYTTTKSGKDLIIGVGSGKITLVGGANVAFTIDGTLKTDDTLISNYASNTIINGTAQADKIANTGNNVTINAGEGNDTITNIGGGENVYINAGNGNNQINNLALNVKIESGSGNDTIKNSHNQNIYLDAGEGDNSIINDAGDYFTIKSGTGNDTISFWNAGSNISIDAGDGDNYVQLEASNSTLKTGKGNDRISNHNDITVSINAGAGNDSINLSDVCCYVTINGGSGNDTINAYGQDNLIQYSNGDGYDIIYGIKSGDTLQITGAKYTTTKSDNDLIFGVGSGKITVVGGANVAFKIDGTLDSGGGTSTDTLPTGISIKSSVLTASTAFTGNKIDLADYPTATKVNASALSKGVSIVGTAAANSIKGGKGADVISGGVGNDTVSLGGGNDIYIYSGGNDLIQDYTAGADTIQFETKINSASLSGSNLIISTDKGSVTVKNGQNKNVSVKDTSGTFKILNEYPTIEPDTLPAGWKYGTSVKTNNDTTILTATIASADNLDLNEEYGDGVKKVDGSKISGGVEIIGNDSGNSIKCGKGDDVIKSGAGNDTVSLGSGNDTYIYSGGDDLIQDYATVDTIQFETDIISASLNGSNLIITTGEGNITVKSGKDKNVSVEDSTGTFTILNEYPTPTIPPDDLYKKFTDKADTISNLDDNATIDALDGIDKIVNEANEVSINAGKGNDKITIEGGAESVTILGGAGNDYIANSGSGNLYQYADGDGKDTIIGYSEDDTLHITEGSYTYKWSKSDLIVTVGKGSITLKDVGEKEVIVKDSNNKTVTIVNESLPKGWELRNGNELYASVSKADNLDLAKPYGEGVEIVDGSKLTSKINIVGNDLGNTITGGSGADIIEGGKGNDELEGGKGNDVFVYSGGDDTITDYGNGKDSIRVEIEDISNIECVIEDNNAVFYTSKGNITVTNVKYMTDEGEVRYKDIILMDGKGTIPAGAKDPDGWTSDADKKLLKTKGKSPSDREIDLNEPYFDNFETVDASAATVNVKIYGNDLNNYLTGGTGKDTLDGGDGNDELTGGKGNDVFIFSGGDDTITDYEAGKDKIVIALDDNIIIDSDTSNNDVIYYFEHNNTLTITKGVGKNIVINDENGGLITAPKASKNVAENIWFLEDDDNFVSSDIDSITENKFEVTNFETENYLSLAQDSHILTFTDKK